MVPCTPHGVGFPLFLSFPTVLGRFALRGKAYHYMQCQGKWEARAESNPDLFFRRERPCPLDDAPMNYTNKYGSQSGSEAAALCLAWIENGNGRRASSILASSGVRLPLRLLHG